MKNKVMAIFIAVYILFPCSVRADLDLLSHIQDVLSSAEENSNVLIKQYTGLQFSNITAVTDRNYLRNMRNQFRDQLKSHAVTALRSTSLNHFTMAGMKNNFISGPYANSALLRNIGQKYTRRTNMRSDYTATQEHNARQNRLMVENASTTLAKAIVLRGKMMKELAELEKDEGKTYDQIPVIKEEYKRVAIRANNRWARILVETAEFAELNANGRLAETRIKPEDAEDDNEETGAVQEYAAGDMILKNNINLGQAWDLATSGKGVFETFSYGNIAGGLSGLGGMVGTSGGIFSSAGTALGQVATGLGGAANVVGAIDSGNYTGAVANAFDGAGSVVGDSVGGAIGSVGDVVRTGANVTESLTSGGGDVWSTMGNATNALSNVANTGANFSGSTTQAEDDAATRREKKANEQQGTAGNGSGTVAPQE